MLRIQLLYWPDCPSHDTAEAMVRQIAAEQAIPVDIERVEILAEDQGKAVCFPGSPTIRVEAQDVEPGWTPCTDCTPRCRIYQHGGRLSGLPDPAWVRAALERASRS